VRKEIALADRRQTVRDAARGWQRAGWIDAEARTAIARAYADDRRRLGPVLRALAFLFALFAAGAGLALLELVTEAHRDDLYGAALVLLYGSTLCVATELLKGKGRLAGAGIESATGLAAGAALLVGTGWVLGEVLDLAEPSVATTAFALGLALFGAAAWRWGSAVSAIVATVFLGLLLAQADHGRLLWILAALALAPLALRASESAAFPPSHRRSAAAVVIVALAGLYLALHLGSWDERLIEDELRFVSGAPAAPDALPRLGFVAATALMPLVVLAYGLASRRRLFWVLGLVFSAASLITLRFYVHVAPLWVILSLAGAGLILIALGLRRWLDGRPDHERGGFTARPLFDDAVRRRLAEVAVSVAVATPDAPHEQERAGFEGGGGRSGGGGATADF
jgi:MFS family permease